ncbi:MAG: EamA family transporter [Paludibacteraceae bacterium]|nr:EamA family transporter [Paludibacteraceae bacterium]MBQ9704961.1 EamA family transporter [Paludibacteraceae bacterium]
MIRLILTAFIQAASMVGGQMLLKLGMQRIPAFSWTWHCILHDVLLNYWLIIGVILLVGTNLLWLYMLKIYPFSVIYPLTSIGFALGMIGGMLLFGESVVWTQWIGVVLIMGGCYLIVR